MIKATPQLDVIMYHYVRDFPRTRFPRIKGMATDNFRQQVDGLRKQYEMATLESALAFLAGRYRPQRDLCLLTFDDGLKEHYTDVLPILDERQIQGVFFIVTRCLEESRVIAVHKNHFLMAFLDFDEYRAAYLRRLADLSPDIDTDVDQARATYVYRWDMPEVAAFKYLLNFHVPNAVHVRILDDLFAKHLGDEREFARELYISWEEARDMQACGMLIGGHSHRHVPLAKLDEPCQRRDLQWCATILRKRLRPQALWPFSYPYGKPNDSFDSQTERVVSELRFSCAFSTEVGCNTVGQNANRLRRIDPKDVTL